MTPAAKPDPEALAEDLRVIAVGLDGPDNTSPAALRAAPSRMKLAAALIEQYERQREELRELCDKLGAGFIFHASDLREILDKFDTPAKGER